MTIIGQWNRVLVPPWGIYIAIWYISLCCSADTKTPPSTTHLSGGWWLFTDQKHVDPRTTGRKRLSFFPVEWGMMVVIPQISPHYLTPHPSEGSPWAATFTPNAAFKNPSLGTSLAVQWLRLWARSAGGLGSIPGQGTRFRMLQPRPGAAKLIN